MNTKKTILVKRKGLYFKVCGLCFKVVGMVKVIGAPSFFFQELVKLRKEEEEDAVNCSLTPPKPCSWSWRTRGGGETAGDGPVCFGGVVGGEVHELTLEGLPLTFPLTSGLSAAFPALEALRLHRCVARTPDCFAGFRSQHPGSSSSSSPLVLGSPSKVETLELVDVTAAFGRVKSHLAKMQNAASGPLELSAAHSLFSSFCPKRMSVRISPGGPPPLLMHGVELEWGGAGGAGYPLDIAGACRQIRARGGPPTSPLADPPALIFERITSLEVN